MHGNTWRTSKFVAIRILIIALMSAAGIPGALDLKCGVDTVAQVTVESAQNGRDRSSAVVSACRTGGVNEQDPKDK
jgi:hypothetical protein